MKIIQANIWGGKLSQQIIDFVHAEQPDFVCMQEVNDLKGRAGYQYFATLDEIKAAAGCNHSFMAATYSSRFMERELSFGNAILSKTAFASTKTVFTHGEHIHNFDAEQNEGNIRNFQVAAVDISDVRLNILNHHGYYVPDSKAGNDETMHATKMIADALRQLEGPIILCGDFNLAPASESLGLINRELTNLSVANGLKRTYNQLSAIQDVCDYIFVNDQVKVLDFQMSEEVVSDHKALILEFELTT